MNRQTRMCASVAGALSEDSLGVEISELLKPANSNFGIVPAEAESYQQKIVQLAQQQYYAAADEPYL